MKTLKKKDNSCLCGVIKEIMYSLLREYYTHLMQRKF